MRSPERQHTLDLPVTHAASSPPLDAASISLAGSDHWQSSETRRWSAVVALPAVDSGALILGRIDLHAWIGAHREGDCVDQRR